MICTGKGLLVTERELVAIEIANGGEAPGDSSADRDEVAWRTVRWQAYVFWLGATDATAFRLCHGEDLPPHPDRGVESWSQAERDRWYA